MNTAAVGGLIPSPQDFKCPNTLLVLCTTVKEMSPTLIEMDFSPLPLLLLYYFHTSTDPPTVCSLSDGACSESSRRFEWRKRSREQSRRREMSWLEY